MCTHILLDEGMQARTHAWTLHLGRRTPHDRIPLMSPLISSPAQMLRHVACRVYSKQWGHSCWLRLSVCAACVCMCVTVCVLRLPPRPPDADLAPYWLPQRSGASRLSPSGSAGSPLRRLAALPLGSCWFSLRRLAALPLGSCWFSPQAPRGSPPRVVLVLPSGASRLSPSGRAGLCAVWAGGWAYSVCSVCSVVVLMCGGVWWYVVSSLDRRPSAGVTYSVLRLRVHAVDVVRADARPLLEEAPWVRPGRVLALAVDAVQVASAGREDGRVRLVHVCR